MTINYGEINSASMRSKNIPMQQAVNPDYKLYLYVNKNTGNALCSETENSDPDNVLVKILDKPEGAPQLYAEATRIMEEKNV